MAPRRSAASSRRSQRRAASEDAIEEAANPTQSQPDSVKDADRTMDQDEPEEVDEDEEEDQAPRRHGKNKARATGPSADPNERGEGSDDDGAIDIEKFENQPLTRSNGAKISSFGKDWQAIKDTAHRSIFPMITDTAAAFADAGGENAEKTIESLEVMLREAVDLEVQMMAHEEVLNSIYQRVSREDQVNNVKEGWAGEVKKKLDKHAAKTSRQKYGKDTSYSAFKQRIFEIQNEGEAMPPVVDLIPREDGDDSDDEDDVIVGGQTQDYKCPLTLTTLVNPLTSKLCGHSFSGDAIKDYLRGGRKQCPASGCNKMLSRGDLQENADLQKRIREAARRERRRAEESDEDEVIE